MDRYLSFDEFKQNSDVDITDKLFDKLEFKAEKIVDKNTSQRIRNLEVSQRPEDLKKLMVEIIENLYTIKNAGGGSITSISNDGYSVNYSDKAFSEDSLDELVCLYLSEYCYLGVNCGICE